MPTPQDDQAHKPDQQQIDPGELSGEQKPPKKETPPEDALTPERKRLEAMQENTKEQAHQVAEEALAVLLAMGWCFGAIMKDGAPEFAILPLPLETWQEVNKEMLRNKLTGGARPGFIVP